MQKVKEGYKMTELGEIPVEWKYKKLEEISSITRLAGAEYSDIWETDKNGKIIALKGYNIGENKLILEDIERITEEMSNRLIRSKLFKNDIVFPCVGTIGKATLINEDNKYHINQNIAKITPNEGIDPLYLTYFLMSMFTKKQIQKFNTSSSQPNVLVGNLRRFNVNIPSLKEQKEISLILSSLDEQIEITDNLIEKTKELKKGLMQKLLTKGIGHSRFKDTEIGKIPEEWEIRRLGDIGEIVTGSTPKTAEKDNYGSEYLWVSPTDMGEKKYIIKTNKMLSKMGFEKTRKLPKGSILVTCIGSTIGKIGISGYELSTNQQINSIICKSNFDNEFIYYIIDFNFSNYMSYISTQAVPIINKTTFSEFQIQVPPVEEQRKISLILSSVDKQIDQYESKKEKLQELKKGLMQKLLTGRIRVKV
ncbi:restriction endonuclease subunit S [Clostridium beijerinckii]|uniref:restriction endonuclease subunit S n=1 Tax=Clostridium beijerinckii TaxID=1520 RepID=UPI0022E53857|nr:restriction endonuclease subunit S [Clostridium beijerinckii]